MKKLKKYIALGDSLTVGVGKGIFSPGFVQLYERFINNDLQQQIKTRVFARSGATTKEVLKKIVMNPRIQEDVKEADIITLTAGGNNLISAVKQFEKEQKESVILQALEGCQRNMTDILAMIDNMKSGDKKVYIVRLVNLYNPFPSVELANKWVDLFNKHIDSFSTVEHVEVADLKYIFAGKEDSLLSKDRIHPNDAGYLEIAKALRQLGYGEVIKNSNV